MNEYKMCEFGNIIEKIMKDMGFGNTFGCIFVVDLYALMLAINKHTAAITWTDDILITKPDGAEIKSFLFISIERPALNLLEQEIGEEIFTIKIPVHDKDDFNVANPLPNSSPLFVILSQMKISNIELEYPIIEENDPDEPMYIIPTKEIAYQLFKEIILQAMNCLPVSKYDEKFDMWSLIN